MKCQQNSWTGCIVHLAGAIMIRGEIFLDYSGIYRRSANEKPSRIVSVNAAPARYWLANKPGHE